MDKLGNITLYNDDCMNLLREFPTGSFDLAIVDPPYGIGISFNPVRQKHQKKQWDNSTPDKAYFDELKRVSKNQIIWGGNYFIPYLKNTQCFIIWDKQQPMNFSLAMCEFAWTSFSRPAKIYSKSILSEKNKIHPTQKPVALYKWLLSNYAEPGDKILDTHLGSGSICIACDDLGFEMTGIELDKDYYEGAKRRLQWHQAQQKLF